MQKYRRVSEVCPLSWIFIHCLPHGLVIHEATGLLMALEIHFKMVYLKLETFRLHEFVKMHV